ncbi:MAG: Uncharacterised protein [Opitutia bacterium UBA7350]|nr:MAG: Uncharacterised protein [Opitutae bacterium UBA7350]
MYSMTGYGRGTASDSTHGLTAIFELSAVNRKSLDAHIYAPREWNGFEQTCQGWLREQVQRGRIQIHLKIEYSNTIPSDSKLNWSEASFDASIQRLRQYAEKNDLPFEISGDFLLNLAKTLKEEDVTTDWRDIEATLKSAFQNALDDLNTMRKTEGKALANDLLQQLKDLEAQCQGIAQHAKETVGQHRDNLLQRLQKLGLELDLDDERLLKELALFADRSDISEEITRLNAHLEQFRSFIGSDKALGRKMDFLCQEIHRELNTTGSKASSIEITRAVLEGKNILERIREQVQNIE